MLFKRHLILLPATALAAASIFGCQAMYDAGFRSDQARYRAIATPDTTGMSEEEAELARKDAENKARRTEWVERERRKSLLGGGIHGGSR